jgi:hypothetical protein
MNERKPTMRFTAVLGMSILLVVSVFGQVTTTGLAGATEMGQSVYGLGFSGGWASGVGVSFRSHFPTKSSLQGVFGIIRTAEKLSLSIGAEYQLDLARGNSTRFFFGSGASYNYYGKDRNEVSGPARVGLGVGGEFQLQEALHFTLSGMFTFFSDGRVLPLPQAALHYYFF